MKTGATKIDDWVKRIGVFNLDVRISKNQITNKNKEEAIYSQLSLAKKRYKSTVDSDFDVFCFSFFFFFFFFFFLFFYFRYLQLRTSECFISLLKNVGCLIYYFQM